MTTLAFDIYGTLIDTCGVTGLLEQHIGSDKAPSFALLWRDKQLEYSFRRALMGAYAPFHVCTSDALAYCIDEFDVEISPQQHAGLIECYLNLPVFDDVIDCLETLSPRADIQAFAFTNGTQGDVETLITNAGIHRHFKAIISVDEIKTFKPDPAVYQYLLDRSGADKKDCWLISGNNFDVIGATVFGMNSVWLKRSQQQHMDPWGVQATHTIRSLAELGALL